jgi:glyoxylase-like metal-dependent hydrolase (beta-lactamase superfamily II)
MIQIGDYTLRVLDAQEFSLDGGSMFGVVPKTMWEKPAPADELNRVRLSTRLLLISGRGRHILIDTGMGTAWSEKHRSIYSISPFRIHEELAAAGLETGDITDIILTHLHFDHVGGAFSLVEGELMPVFPNARILVQEENYRTASRPNVKERVSYNPAFIDALGRLPSLVLVSGEQELFAGIDIIISNGHTRGQQLVRISDGQKTLVHGGDLVPSAAHLPVAWITGFDIEPLTVIEEKSALLQEAFEKEWIIFFGHDPLIHAATVQRGEKGFVPGPVLKL